MIPETAPSTTRVALVTGAAQGIGLTIALQLADDGLDVAVNDIPVKRELLQDVVSQIEAKGRRSIAICADISVEEEVEQMVSFVAARLGSLDVMVANAGILQVKPLLESSVEEWDRIMSVNIRGTVLSYKYAAKQMIKQGRGGRIIGASSVAGKRGWGGLSGYCATKFAVRGITQCLSIELAKHSITVNSYAPGVIQTEMGKDLGVGLEACGHLVSIPVSGPESVAYLVSYLAKPESQFVTGQTISVNGGAWFD